MRRSGASFCARLVLVALAIAGAATSLAAGDARPRAPRKATGANEPFTTLQAVDKELSFLNARLPQVEKARAAGKNDAAFDRSLRRIEILSERLAQRYRKQRQPFGHRMFALLQERAVAARRASHGNADNGARGAAPDLQPAMLALVMQYQSSAANYGANHCDPGTRACCQPRPQAKAQPREPDACQWSCVRKVSACRGFTGPLTPTR